MTIISNTLNFILFVIFIFSGFIKASTPDGNGVGYENTNCETVYTTVTPQAASTFTYTTTEIVPGGSAGVVTKYVQGSNDVVIDTLILEGQTRTFTLHSVTTKFIGATTTKYSTVTFTTYPSATTTVYSTETVVKMVKGTLTVTYPIPVVTISSLSRYTGAPTSLWLSVI